MLLQYIWRNYLKHDLLAITTKGRIFPKCLQSERKLRPNTAKYWINEGQERIAYITKSLASWRWKAQQSNYYLLSFNHKHS